MMSSLLIPQEDITWATWWHHCPGCRGDRLHNMWTPDPSVLSDNHEDEREALVKGRKWKAEWRSGVRRFLFVFFWSTSSLRHTDLPPDACDAAVTPHWEHVLLAPAVETYFWIKWSKDSCHQSFFGGWWRPTKVENIRVQIHLRLSGVFRRLCFYFICHISDRVFFSFNDKICTFCPLHF